MPYSKTLTRAKLLATRHFQKCVPTSALWEREKREATRHHSTVLPILRPLPRALVVRQASLYTTPESSLASLTLLSANLETIHDFHANLHDHCSPRRCVGFSAASRERRPLST